MGSRCIHCTGGVTAYSQKGAKACTALLCTISPQMTGATLQSLQLQHTASIFLSPRNVESLSILKHAEMDELVNHLISTSWQPNNRVITTASLKLDSSELLLAAELKRLALTSLQLQPKFRVRRCLRRQEQSPDFLAGMYQTKGTLCFSSKSVSSHHQTWNWTYHQEIRIFWTMVLHVAVWEREQLCTEQNPWMQLNKMPEVATRLSLFHQLPQDLTVSRVLHPQQRRELLNSVTYFAGQLLPTWTQM